MDSLTPAFLGWFSVFLVAFVVTVGITAAVVLIARRQPEGLNDTQQKIGGGLAYGALAVVVVSAVGTVVSSLAA